jgi:hypothetical protein
LAKNFFKYLDRKAQSGYHIIMKNSKKFVSDFPHLMAEWDYEKNVGVDPNKVTAGSHKKFWWKCPVADDHRWQANIYNRTGNDSGCPCCTGKKIVLSNCLTTNHPELAKEWDYEKNGYITPYDVADKSHKKVWWKCPVADDHRWQANISNRTSNDSGCPCCAGKKIVLSNCLATTHPELANEWHYEKNGDLTPYDITFGSHNKVWWKCLVADDHEWQAAVCTRTSNDSGCPCCAGKKIVLSNCLATTHPELAKEWHYEKNGDLTPYDITFGSHNKVWWKCLVADDHEWQAPPNNRTKNDSGCPCCTGKKIVLSNCLAVIHPKIAAQWHPTKNGDLTPYDVTTGSNNKVWWKCLVADDHEWQAPPSNRTNNGSGCPHCVNYLGEIRIEEILKESKTHFIRQYKDHSCRNKKRLPFDFAILKENIVIALIEYHGKQHYTPISFGSKTRCPEEMFKEIQQRDLIKKQWCETKNIPFLEIPYTEFDNIENIIIEFLNKL